MKKLLISLFIISFAIADDHIKMVEGTFVSNELSGKKTRIIVKKGKGFNEIVTFENSNGEITNKFETDFTLQPLFGNVHLFITERSRTYSGKNFNKKEKWNTPGWKYLIEFDENFLYESWSLTEPNPQYKYMRDYDWTKGEYHRTDSKMSLLSIMDGKYEAEDGTIFEFKWDGQKSLLTQKAIFPTNDGMLLGMMTVWSYDFTDQRIKGNIYNAGGDQIDMYLISAVDNIIVFGENSNEPNGGSYQCITTFDFSEEGKLKWSATNRHDQITGPLEDLSADLIKQ